TSVSGDRGKKIFCDIMIERQALAFDQPENDFSRCRRMRIDDHKIAVAGITQVVVDVDPNFRRANGSECGSEPVLNCGVKRDGNIDILCGEGGLVSNSARGRKQYFSSIPSSFHARTSLPSC